MLVMRRIEGETSGERKRGSCSEKKKTQKMAMVRERGLTGDSERE